MQLLVKSLCQADCSGEGHQTALWKSPINLKIGRVWAVEVLKRIANSFKKDRSGVYVRFVLLVALGHHLNPYDIFSRHWWSEKIMEWELRCSPEHAPTVNIMIVMSNVT